MSANRKITLTGRGELVLGDGADKKTALRSAASIVADLLFTLPNTAGVSGYMLVTDGSGNLSWAPPGTGVFEFSDITITDGGEVFWEDDDGSETVSLKAPATLNETYVLTFPVELPPDTQFVTIDETGAIDFSTGDATLQSAYEADEEILVDDTNRVTLTQSNNDLGALLVQKSGTGTGAVVTITDAGTGGGLVLTQTGNAAALAATKTDGAAAVATFTGAGSISGAAVSAVQGASATGHAIAISQSGSGMDVLGTSSNWRVSKLGVIRGKRLEMTAAAHTIASGAVTINGAGMLVVDTEGAVASDDLENINVDAGDSAQQGTILVVRAANDNRTVVCKDGSGNLRLSADMTLDNGEDTLTLIYTGSVWLELARSNNAA